MKQFVAVLIAMVHRMSFLFLSLRRLLHQRSFGLKGPFWRLFVLSAVCWTLACSGNTILFQLLKVLIHGRILRALSKA